MRARWLVLLPLVASALAVPADSAEVLEELNRQLTDTVVVPGYQRFAAAAQSLEGAVAAFCNTPALEQLEAARSAFAQAMLAWQQVQPIVLGPRCGPRSSNCFRTGVASCRGS